MDSLHGIQAICEYHKHQLRAVPLCSLQIASSFHETFLIKYNGIQGMGDTRTPTINNWSSFVRQNEHGYFPNEKIIHWGRRLGLFHGTERNGTERNGTERNAGLKHEHMERSTISIMSLRTHLTCSYCGLFAVAYATYYLLWGKAREIHFLIRAWWDVVCLSAWLMEEFPVRKERRNSDKVINHDAVMHGSLFM